MPLPFTQVDAFAHGPFSGNPAAVYVLESYPSDDFLAKVACEMNLSETAFVVRTGPSSFDLRWFTPNTEVDLCGHATLGAAHALFEDGEIEGDEVSFHTRSGALAVTRNQDRSLTMNFPTEEPRGRPRPADLETMLGAPVAWYGENRMDAFVQLDQPGWVRSLDPDMSSIARLPVRGLIVTATGDAPEYDFISRFFAPQSGVPEDPVTGSAHCALAPFWHDRLGSPKLTGFQASARGGRVQVEHDGDRVLLTGRAVTVLRGELLVDPE
ncbi:MAG: PhzF family phenazine biosynthesis protein [Rhodothermales bacterium]|nr:PhzF family phenazine biosynthesis protein [Rhodothermales bacterium]MBO6778927.1 PhzF family phenazine biosynthesis protein [Rhodothermales bacterium]